MWTIACSLRAGTKGRSAWWAWSAWPSPPTLPWPKMPRHPAKKRVRRPSRSTCCAPRKRTSAWATVIRSALTVPTPRAGRPAWASRPRTPAAPRRARPRRWRARPYAPAPTPAADPDERAAERVAGAEAAHDVDGQGRRLDTRRSRAGQHALGPPLDDRQLDAQLQQGVGGGVRVTFTDGHRRLVGVPDGHRGMRQRRARPLARLALVAPEHRAVIEVVDGRGAPRGPVGQRGQR